MRPVPVDGPGRGCKTATHLKIENGQIYDHHFVEYEYADGTLLYSQARQIPNCWRSISESAVGTLGRAVLDQKTLLVG